MNEFKFIKFVSETKGIVLAAIRRYLPHDLYHLIDDVSQETYIRIYKNIDGMEFKNSSSRRNWVYTIAKNESLRIAEKYRKEDLKIQNIIETIQTTKRDQREVFNEDINIIHEVIACLPGKYRHVFELLILGFSETQISEELSIKQGTIKSRVHRGKELILRHLSKKGVNYEIT